jgi:SAM-dependent methyltransferase
LDRAEIIYLIGKVKRRLKRTGLFNLLLLPLGPLLGKTSSEGKGQRQRRRVSRHWDTMTNTDRPVRIDWWQSPRVRQHVSRIISGREGEALIDLAKRRSGRVLETGVSVGCGTGTKEMALIEGGLVKSFILFELSQERIKKGIALAERRGLGDCVRFRSDGAFEVIPDRSVDIVYWSGALHHMLDVEAAVSWSRRILMPGGMFLVDDFVGPTRFRWGKEEMDLATRVRRLLPDRYLKSPYHPQDSGVLLPRRIRRPNLLAMRLTDPSEAAQSGQILESILRHFPNAEIIPTGGAVYHLALSEVIHNFDENDEYDLAILDLMLLVDELSLHHPGIQSYFAAAIAFKDE